MKTLIFLVLLTKSAMAQIDTDGGANQANGGGASQNCSSHCDLSGNCTTNCL